MRLTRAQWNALTVLGQGWASVGDGTFSGRRRGVHRRSVEILSQRGFAVRSYYGYSRDGTAEITEAGRRALADREAIRKLKTGAR